MEPITIAALSAFLKSCLLKAGQKFSEKAIETIFERKKELADCFTSLFRQEIVTLGLNSATTPEETQKQLDTKPEVALQALKKLVDNPQLLADFNKQIEKTTGGMKINAENIGQVIKENYGTINQTINFS